MPPFGRAAGGLLTDRQVAAIAKGIVDTWGHADQTLTQLPSYSQSNPGDPTKGQSSYATSCARCHGANGGGESSGNIHTGSIIDPTYLALVSDQFLRSTIIAGQPEQGMPDWRSDLTGPNARPLTDQEITDTVAWLAAHRITTPGEPYPQQP
jgi:cytochrome c oxidase cbb3-type subunit 3/ubiquinol-cytochrome c reductase cytochrome c subunit